MNQLYIPSLLNLSPTPYPSHTSRSSQSTRLSSLLHSHFPLAIGFMYSNVYVSVLLSQFVPPTPSPVLLLCLFCLTLRRKVA